MTGIWLGLALVSGAGLGWAAVAGLAGASVVAVVDGGRRRVWTFALVAFALVGVVRVAGQPEQPIADWTDEDPPLIGAIASGPVETGRVQIFLFNARPNVSADDAGANALLCATAPLLPKLGFGDEISATGSIHHVDEFDERSAGYLRSRGCAGSIELERIDIVDRGSGVRAVLDRVRRKMTASLQAAFPGDRGALMAGLVTGDDAGLSRSKRDAFIITGTSHVTAVSGSNLAVIVALLTFAGGVVRRGHSAWWHGTVVVALWGYVAVIGMSPPPFRAACVATLALAALRLGRRPDFVTLSVLAAAAELLYRPSDFGSLAFRLSTVSAIALVLGLAGRSPRGFRGWMTHAVIATAATQAATSPLLIPAFGRLTVYAIPANLVIAPLCSIAFPFALLAGIAGLFSETLAFVIAAPAVLPVNIALAAAAAFAKLPYADTGAALASAFPAWWWTALGIAAVFALSRECRGGFRRIVTNAEEMSVERKSMLTTATAAAIGGILIGLWLR